MGGGKKGKREERKGGRKRESMNSRFSSLSIQMSMWKHGTRGTLREFHSAERVQGHSLGVHLLYWTSPMHHFKIPWAPWGVRSELHRYCGTSIRPALTWPALRISLSLVLWEPPLHSPEKHSCLCPWNHSWPVQDRSWWLHVCVSLTHRHTALRWTP